MDVNVCMCVRMYLQCVYEHVEGIIIICSCVCVYISVQYMFMCVCMCVIMCVIYKCAIYVHACVCNMSVLSIITNLCIQSSMEESHAHISALFTQNPCD